MFEVDIIRAKLVASDPAEREEGLAALQDQGAIIPLADVRFLANDPDAAVRNAFLETLHIYGGAAVQTCALMALSDADEIVRITAAETLTLYPPENHVLSEIEKHLDDPDPVVRRSVAEIFGVEGRARNVRMLEARLKSESSNQARIGLLSALYKLGRGECLRQLCAMLQATDYHDRCATASVLADLFSDTANADVSAALRDALANERTIAARSAFEDAIARIAGDC